jgi:hypothetical protein
MRQVQIGAGGLVVLGIAALGLRRRRVAAGRHHRLVRDGKPAAGHALEQPEAGTIVNCRFGRSTTVGRPIFRSNACPEGHTAVSG